MDYELSNIESKAIFSNDKMKEYRYKLTRCWDRNKKQATFIMLNPSKATHLKFDNTIMNIHNFIIDYENESYGSYSVVNLFSYRSTDPKKIVNRDQKYEKNNEHYLIESFKSADIIVVAWGRDFSKVGAETKGHILKQIDKTLKLLNNYSEKVYVFWDGEETKEDLKPRHPVFLKSNWTLIEYKFK